jgi:hypothetical protein
MAFLFSVCSNYGTIKLYEVVSPQFYLFFPLCALIIPLALSLTLPFTIDCHENSLFILEKWKEEIAFEKFRGKYRMRLRKKINAELKSIRPILFHARIFYSNIFALKRSLKCSFYKSIADYTFSAVITF